MATASTSPDDRSGLPEPPLFRFGLRQLFYFVAIVSFVLAAAVLSQGIAALAMLLAVLVVAAHLFSTALASRLRARSDYEQAITRSDRRNAAEAGSLPEHASQPTILCSSRSPWHARGSTALPWLPRTIVAGIVIGGLVGVAVLGLSIGHRTTLAGVAVGGFSSAVLGGWFAFLGGSFYGIVRHGIRDALNDARQNDDERQRRRRP